MVEYLDLEDLLTLTQDLRAGPVRDPGLLEAAVARPRTSVFGDDAYPSLFEKAAALLHSICQNHALVDGNKRLAWLAADVFLRINDTVIEMTDEDAFALVMRVAADHVEVADIAAVLESAPRS
ncbi:MULTISPECIES: type II toxin-antitoxin system death-on-curing family toxin [unclassified Nocardioides]|uniref:type II toxin-antitoxin system death-on-curing family toxin n=1 Tax=unclassified Nocardioides TaxID=2615069 RepID=UPI0006F2AD8E|nr:MULTISPECIES: type II toxin-antitoxin system death-on-curing family toxin [unclassified Nocardioides]KRA31421.1 alcohol dehydrogenase [Nocardioides sp. Root614]KRA88041.1 alcohol dehydrogenase [Nocardioides sp. Root682]